MLIKLQYGKFLSLMPESNEIDGWLKEKYTKLENNNQHFSRYPLELLTYGAAQGVLQKYAKNDDDEGSLELALYDMRNIENAIKIYRKLSIRTEAKWDINTQAAEARIDDSRLFTYLLDVRKYGYFMRIIVSGKDSGSLQTAKRFAQRISNKIEDSRSR